MMLGVPCMSFIRPEFREKYCPDCPVIQATPDTIYEVLKNYISKPDELSRIGKFGPDFIQKYHSDARSIKPLIECYQTITNRANM
jgi:predicted nucleotide-binding protein (sugar kinase/HSP70/actin superfamily)